MYILLTIYFMCPVLKLHTVADVIVPISPSLPPSLQNDLQKYEVRIKSLQAHSEQQGKVLRRKTEEVRN